MYTSEVAASYIHTHIKIHTNTCTHTELFSVSVHCRDTGQLTLAWHIADQRSRPKRRSTSSPAFSLFSPGVLTNGWIIKQQVIIDSVVVTLKQETRSYELAQSGAGRLQLGEVPDVSVGRPRISSFVMISDHNDCKSVRSN